MEPTSSPLQMLTRLNSEALRLLWEGEEEHSIALLRICFTRAKDFLLICRPGNSKSQNTGLETVDFRCILNPDESTVCADNYFSLYRNVFTIETDQVSSALPICAAVSYNLALIHHESALQSGCLKQLCHARDSYEVSLSFVRQNKDSFLRQPGLEELELACYSNLGHLYSVFGDSNGIQDCRDGLQAALLENRWLQDPCLLDFFQRSLRLSRCHKVGIAAAA